MIKITLTEENLTRLVAGEILKFGATEEGVAITVSELPAHEILRGVAEGLKRLSKVLEEE